MNNKEINKILFYQLNPTGCWHEWDEDFRCKNCGIEGFVMTTSSITSSSNGHPKKVIIEPRNPDIMNNPVHKNLLIQRVYDSEHREEFERWLYNHTSPFFFTPYLKFASYYLEWLSLNQDYMSVTAKICMEKILRGDNETIP